MISVTAVCFVAGATFNVIRALVVPTQEESYRYNLLAVLYLIAAGVWR